MTYTHKFASTAVAANTLPVPDGLRSVDDYFWRGEFFSFLPAFHVSQSYLILLSTNRLTR
jgi:hypothetical protein